MINNKKCHTPLNNCCHRKGDSFWIHIKEFNSCMLNVSSNENNKNALKWISINHEQVMINLYIEIGNSWIVVFFFTVFDTFYPRLVCSTLNAIYKRDDIPCNRYDPKPLVVKMDPQRKVFSLLVAEAVRYGALGNKVIFCCFGFKLKPTHWQQLQLHGISISNLSVHMLGSVVIRPGIHSDISSPFY